MDKGTIRMVLLLVLSLVCFRFSESYSHWSLTRSRSVTRSYSSSNRLHRTAIYGHRETNPQCQGWHQQVLRKVFRNKKDLLNMQNVAVMERTPTDLFPFARLPVSRESDDAFHQSPPPLLDMVVNESDHAYLDSLQERNRAEQRVSFFTRIVRMAIQSELMKRLDRWSRGQYSNLQVRCNPTGNILQFLQGKAHFDATITLDRIVFNDIRFSGGQLNAQNFAINLLNGRRFPNQFGFLGTDLTLTQEDLFESSCIRNGLRRLITRIFKNRGLTVIAHNLKSIRILPSGKVSIIGQVAPLVGPVIHFEMRSGITFSKECPNMISFPALEISLNPALGFFVPILPDVTLDLGRDAQLLDLELNGEAGHVRVSARVVITPCHDDYDPQQPKIMLDTIRSQSSTALCSVDVGQWLTHLGQFSR